MLSFLCPKSCLCPHRSTPRRRSRRFLLYNYPYEATILPRHLGHLRPYRSVRQELFTMSENFAANSPPTAVIASVRFSSLAQFCSLKSGPISFQCYAVFVLSPLHEFSSHKSLGFLMSSCFQLLLKDSRKTQKIEKDKNRKIPKEFVDENA